MNRKLIGGISAFTLALIVPSFCAGYVHKKFQQYQYAKQCIEMIEQPSTSTQLKFDGLRTDNEAQIDKLIEERIKEAQDKKLIDKAMSIYYYVAEYKPNGSILTKETGLFKITYPIDHKIQVTYNGREVLEGKDSLYPEKKDFVDSYIPGEWENEFEIIYQKSLINKEEKEKKDFRERATRFGLEDKIEEGVKNEQ